MPLPSLPLLSSVKCILVELWDSFSGSTHASTSKAQSTSNPSARARAQRERERERERESFGIKKGRWNFKHLHKQGSNGFIQEKFYKVGSRVEEGRTLIILCLASSRIKLAELRKFKRNLPPHPLILALRREKHLHRSSFQNPWSF